MSSIRARRRVSAPTGRSRPSRNPLALELDVVSQEPEQRAERRAHVDEIAEFEAGPRPIRQSHSEAALLLI
jgi:hypothetical protein